MVVRKVCAKVQPAGHPGVAFTTAGTYLSAPSNPAMNNLPRFPLLALAGPSHQPPEGLEEKVIQGVLELEAGPTKRAVRGHARVPGRPAAGWAPARWAAVGVAAVICAGLLLAARLRWAGLARRTSRGSPASWPAQTWVSPIS